MLKTQKISKVYRDHLGELASDQQSRAIVVIKADTPRRSFRGLSPAERRKILDETSSSAQAAAAQIDNVLSRYGGRRLRNKASGLGTFVIEAPPEAIVELTNLEQVEFILQDQEAIGLDLDR